MAKELLKRSEVKEEFTWKLEDMYASPQDWEADILRIKEMADVLTHKEGKLDSSAEELYNSLELMMEMDQKISLAFNYASRLSDQDTKNTANQAKLQRLAGAAAEINSRLAFWKLIMPRSRNWSSIANILKK